MGRGSFGVRGSSGDFWARNGEGREHKGGGMAGSKQGSVLRSLSLVGRVGGEVRHLAGFDRKRHTVPEQANGTTQAFLAKLCAGDLAGEAEGLFRQARERFGYKRREISLAVDGGVARLEAKDFVLELRCELEAAEPSRYFFETELTQVGSRDLLDTEAFGAAIGRRFDRLRCGFRLGASVEAVIDAVEADETGDLTVDYPSSCAECSVRIEGMDAEIVVTGAMLEVRFRRLATAGELLQAFESVGERFAASPGLADLVAVE